MTEIRPEKHMQAAMKMYPSAPKQVDIFRSSRGKDIPNWPDWCFMPMAGWYAIVGQDHGGQVPLSLIGDVAQLGAIGTWRYTQGVYRIEPELMAALIESPLSGDLPCDVLYRLPEWCLYIETPGQTYMKDQLYGFWVHLESDANTGQSELRLLLDCERQLQAMPLHLGSWSLETAIEKAVELGAQHAPQLKGLYPNLATEIQRAVEPLISLVVYLCSDEPEIDDEREPGAKPERPRPKRTKKKGWRLFAPKKPRVWTVGANISAELRKAADEAGELTGRSVRPHIRRGHWHGFWTGPRDGERRFRYRWLPPMLVRGSNDPEQASTD